MRYFFFNCKIMPIKEVRKLENATIRLAAKANRVPLWEIAKAINVSEATITRMFRNKISDDNTQIIMSIIRNLASTKKK